VTRKGGRTSQGTGFLVSAGGEVLTNFHVADNAESIQVYFSETLWHSARRIVAQDPEKDLALLRIERVAPSLP
jgi:S1-C subfamily serine protease